MYPRRILFATVPLLLCAALHAQMHHVDKPQRVTRAVGVYEWTGDIAKPNASRLIPISLFIDSHFEDAGVYLAQPVPLAVETGNVYAIQRSGDPIGTLDLDFARNVVSRRDVADDNPIGAWYGYGRFLPLSTEPKPALHPSAHPAVIVSSSDDDDKPHFVNRSPAAASSTDSASPSPSASPAPPADPDRPTLHRGTSSGSATTDNAPASPGTASVPDDDPERPTLGRRDEQQNEKHRKHASDGGAVIPMSTSLNDDPNRPMLHRGKVDSELAPPALTGTPRNVHQAVAVSDAITHEPHVFAREWESPAERTEMLAALQTLAQPLAQQYMTTNHLQAAPATSASSAASGPKLVTTPSRSSRKSRSTHRSTAPKAPLPLAFEDAQIAGFALSYGGLPTFVYTAAAPTAADGPLVHVTLVAQRLPSGELQTSLGSVTDDAHLDRTPWMRLVDAVDPDDSHRASLLFELRASASRQFALYSLVSAHAQQTFVTGIIE